VPFSLIENGHELTGSAIHLQENCSGDRNSAV